MDNTKLVEYVARLAHIQITDQQKQFLSSQLSKILEYIDKLKEVDVAGVEPLRGLHKNMGVLRPDEAKSCDLTEDILKNAPSREDNYFKIPKVIE